MTEDERWNYLVKLDEELLIGGVILSEWCTFIVKEADTAFAKGAFLASLLTVVSGIETYLRSEYEANDKSSLYELIENASLGEELIQELHSLRKYRNKWVHVNHPWEDEEIIQNPGKYENEIEFRAIGAMKTLRKVLYENSWI